MRTTHLKTLIITTLLALAASLIPAQAQRFSLINLGASWTWNTDCQDNTGWEQELFDDSGWLSGPSGFTGGETAAGILPILNTRTLPAPGGARNGAAMYFRAHFTLASAANVSLILSNAIDDCAVFYINGTRVKDLRMTADPALCAAFGGAAIGAATDAMLWEVFTLDSAALAGIIHDGPNVIAVSVHQSGAGSSDMVFATTLSGEIAFPPVNCGSLVNSSTNVLQCRDLNIVSCFDGGPAPTIQWKLNGTPIDPTINPTATNAMLVLTNLQAADGGIYQAMAMNPSGMASSAQTMVNVQADTAGPILLSAVGGSPRPGDDQTSTITLTFNEPILPSAGDPTQADSYDAANVEITPACGGDTSFGLFAFGAVLVAPNQVVVQADAARIPGERYRIHLVAGAGLRDLCVGNLVPDTAIDICVTSEFQDDLNGYLGTHDTELRGGNAANATPQGNNVTINVDDADGTPAGPSHGLLRFDSIIGNGPGQVPANATIVAVRLTLTSSAANANTVNEVRVHRMLQTWDEDTATWDSFTAGISANNVEAASAIDVAFTPNVPTPPPAFVLNLSSPEMVATVQSWVNNPASNHGWAFLPTGGDGYRLDTSESAIATDRPRLLVCYTVPQAPIVITRQPLAMVMVNEGGTVVVDVENSGSDARYQWRKGASPVADGGRVSGATTARLVISNAIPADSGNYQVNISNCVPSSALSTVAQVVVKADTNPPTILVVCGLTNLDCIQVTFSEQVGQASAENINNYSIAGLTIISATLTNGTNVILKTTARTPAQNYVLHSSGVRDLSVAMNPSVAANVSVAQLFVVFLWDQVWRYEQFANLDNTGWQNVGYDDSLWPSGAGILALETATPALPPFNTPLSVSATQITYYFRTTFDFPYDTAGVVFTLNYAVDDGALGWLNGSPSFHDNMPNVPFNTITYTSTAIAAVEATIHSTNILALPGPNTLAVEVHQPNAASSDILWGAELIAKVPQFRAACGRPHIVLLDPNPNPTQVRIEWSGTGVLQGANVDVSGPYADIPTATSPYTTATTPPNGFKFYRVRCP